MYIYSFYEQNTDDEEDITIYLFQINPPRINRE